MSSSAGSSIFFAKTVYARTLNSCMSAAAHIAPVVALLHTFHTTMAKEFLRSYQEIADYLFKKFQND